MTRAEAKALGYMLYNTGKPCKNGHIANRYVHGGCLMCKKDRARKHASKDTAWAWASSVARQAKMRANRAEPPIPHNIDAKHVYALLSDKCPVFGTKFMFYGNKKSVPESPSIDRLDPKLGYVPGNVVIISMKANRIKNAYGSEEILKVGRWLKRRGL